MLGNRASSMIFEAMSSPTQMAIRPLKLMLPNELPNRAYHFQTSEMSDLHDLTKNGGLDDFGVPILSRPYGNSVALI